MAVSSIAAVVDYKQELGAIMTSFPIKLVSQNFITSTGKEIDTDTYVPAVGVWKALITVCEEMQHLNEFCNDGSKSKAEYSIWIL